MITVVFDLETQGLPDFNARARDPHQPHIVQYAAILFDGAKEVESYQAIVKPDGWVIPDEVAAIHGITNEIALAKGIPEVEVATHFLAWVRHCGLVVAHNDTFDRFLMRIAFRRFNLIEDADDPWWKAFPRFCTMRAMTNACNLPGKYGKPKWPKLGEAYRHAFGEELVGAHDALVDVRACARLFFWLEAQGLVQPFTGNQPAK